MWLKGINVFWCQILYEGLRKSESQWGEHHGISLVSKAVWLSCTFWKSHLFPSSEISGIGKKGKSWVKPWKDCQVKNWRPVAYFVPGSVFFTEDRSNKFIWDEKNYLCLMHESLFHIYKEDRCVVVVGVVHRITILVDESLLYMGWMRPRLGHLAGWSHSGELQVLGNDRVWEKYVNLHRAAV